jgi:hypothetical protein
MYLFGVSSLQPYKDKGILPRGFRVVTVKHYIMRPTKEALFK